MCSYALANWEMYLTTNQASYLSTFLSVAEVVKNSVEVQDGLPLYIVYEDHTKKVGRACAMSQGEAISVLIRAHEATGKQDYLKLALRASKVFDYHYGQRGVSKRLPGSKKLWYMEVGKYILNGHIYACWGLWELSQYTGDPDVRRRFNIGVDSLEYAIERFDNGWWSSYWLNEPIYIASIMYHNLHIVQLEVMSAITGSAKIAEIAWRFEKYAKSPWRRFRAGVCLLSSKIRRYR